MTKCCHPDRSGGISSAVLRFWKTLSFRFEKSAIDPSASLRMMVWTHSP